MVDELSVCTINLENDPTYEDLSSSNECEFVIAISFTIWPNPLNPSLLKLIIRDFVPDFIVYTCTKFRISTHPFQFQTTGSTVTRIRSTCCVNITSNMLASSPSPTILSTPKSATWFLHCRWCISLGYISYFYRPIFRALPKSSLCWSKTISESIIQVSSNILLIDEMDSENVFFRQKRPSRVWDPRMESVHRQLGRHECGWSENCFQEVEFYSRIIWCSFLKYSVWLIPPL